VGNTNRLGESEQCERQCCTSADWISISRRRRFTRRPIPGDRDRNNTAAAGLPRSLQQSADAERYTSQSSPSVSIPEQRQAWPALEDAEVFERKRAVRMHGGGSLGELRLELVELRFELFQRCEESR